MSYFIDTNIPIGYSIIHDKWHESSKNFIDNHQNDPIYWSNIVKQEYTQKLNNMITNVNIFLNYCKKLLKNNQKDFVNYIDFKNFLIVKTKSCLLDDFKKRKILEHFWNSYSFIEGISEEIYLKFNDFCHEFERLYLIRDKSLQKILILHDCGLNNFKRYINYSIKLNEWGIHSPDNKIITDAHDCGLKHENLIFVSNDSEIINIILEHDHSFLSIIEFKSCSYN